MYIIDAHVHLGLKQFVGKIPEERLNLPAFQFPIENTIESQLELMDETGIAKAVIFPYPYKEIDYGKANSYIIEAAEKFPDRFIPFGLLCNNSKVIKSWAKKGMQGFKLHLVYQDKPVTYYNKVYKLLEEKGLPLIVHASFNNKVNDINEILKVAPCLKIILAHMGRKWPGRGDGALDVIYGVKEFGNVFFETSTVKDSILLESAIELVGEHRIVFGSDYPFGHRNNLVNVIEDEKSFILHANIPTQKKDLIFSRNMIRIIMS